MPFRFLARKISIDLRLLPAERVTFGDAALRGFDRAPATPAVTVSGEMAVHLIAGVVNAAAVAEQHLRHRIQAFHAFEWVSAIIARLRC